MSDFGRQENNRGHGLQITYWRLVTQKHRSNHGHQNIFWAKESRRRILLCLFLGLEKPDLMVKKPIQ